MNGDDVTSAFVVAFAACALSGAVVASLIWCLVLVIL